uniref:Immunoglobulin domain-containing protein n=1 Tax=Oreochromis niloticus TaxID=8128 RepID=A0A669EQR6_ORENI
MHISNSLLFPSEKKQHVNFSQRLNVLLFVIHSLDMKSELPMNFFIEHFLKPVCFLFVLPEGTPSLYVDHQRITGYIEESITIRCHHSNSGEMKWCRLGRNCVTGSSGSTDGTTVTAHMRDPNVFTVTMSGLRTKDSGWYWCAKGDIQIPVYLTVTEKPITTTTTAATTPTTATGSSTTHTVAGSGTITTVEENKEHRASFDPKILIIPLSVLTLIVIVMLFIWFIMRHKQNKAESSATAMGGDEVTYSEVRPKKKRSPKVTNHSSIKQFESKNFQETYRSSESTLEV